MRLRTLALGLAALGVWVGGAGAQVKLEALGYPVEGHVWHGHVNSVPQIPPTNVGSRAYTPTQYPPVELYREPGVFRFLISGLQSHGLLGWGHQERPTTGTLRSELAFIFGSARTFYGEPLMHGPPGIPAPTPAIGVYGPPPLSMIPH